MMIKASFPLDLHAQNGKSKSEADLWGFELQKFLTRSEKIANEDLLPLLFQHEKDDSPNSLN